MVIFRPLLLRLIFLTVAIYLRACIVVTATDEISFFEDPEERERVGGFQTGFRWWRSTHFPSFCLLHPGIGFSHKANTEEGKKKFSFECKIRNFLLSRGGVNLGSGLKLKGFKPEPTFTKAHRSFIQH